MAKNDKPTKLEELQKEAVSLGMPQVDADKFDNEELLESTVNTLRALNASKVVSLEEKANPKEDKDTEKNWRSKADRQKAYFDSQDQVTVMIPLEPGEKQGVVETRIVNGREEVFVKSGAVWSKSINGYRIVVPKGVYTPVAKDIAENISNELNQTLNAGEQWKIDRLDPQTGQPVRNQL